MGSKQAKIIHNISASSGEFNWIIDNLKEKLISDPNNQIKKFPICNLWNRHQGLTIIIFSLRWECAVCRLGAFELSIIKDTIDYKYGKDSIGYYAIVANQTGYEHYKEEKFFSGKLYMDNDTVADKYIVGKSHCLASIKKLLCKKIVESLKQDKDIKYNFKREKITSTRLRGTVLMNQAGVILYHKPHKFYRDHLGQEKLLFEIEAYYKKQEKKNEKDGLIIQVLFV